MKTQKIRDLIREFSWKQRDAFTLDELMKFVQQAVPEFDDDERLFNTASESEWLFGDDRVEDTDVFIPRHCLFKGTEFLVKPLPEEVEDGCLVPGHRFMPFIANPVFPPEATVKLPDGSAVATRQKSFPQETARRFLVFFGEIGMLAYLIHDIAVNGSRLNPPFDAPVDMTVFDLRKFYRHCGFKVGDSLMFKVEDWNNGELSVRHVPAKGRAVDFVCAHAWVQALRGGFEQMRCVETLRFDCAEQIAWMFFYAEQEKRTPSVLADPPLSLPEFFSKQKDLTIKTLGQSSFFWPVDVPVEERLKDSAEWEGPEPETELDGFFQMMNLSLDSDDAEAYMRDALARGEQEPEKVLLRVLQGRDNLFPNEIIRQEFLDLWLELWHEVRDRYSPALDTFREVREVFLEQNDKCLKILRELDKAGVDPHAVISNPAYVQLTEVSAMIHSTLWMANQSETKAKTPPMPLDQMGAVIGELLDTLAAELLPKKPGAKRKQPKNPVLQLKITLRNSKPPIWRRVLVDAGMPLETLHDVIQLSFGWEDVHLHQFIKDRMYFQPGGSDDDFVAEMDVEDSNAYRVCDLLRREQATLVYEYDFGDSWEHQVVLEKILEPKPRQALPVCVKGMRACPPEDCGGIWGYYQMLATLKGPDCAEKSELLEWTNGLVDPDAFNLAAVNARLSEL